MQNGIHRAGFTLTELLLVAGTTGFLVMTLLIAAGPTRKAARATTCLSHLRQIGMAYKMYLDDYGHYPRPSAVTSSPYLADRRVLFCQEDRSYLTEGSVSSYQYRSRTPPDFTPITGAQDLHPETVLAVCPHHAGRERLHPQKVAVTLSALAYPYHLVLRADGRTGRVRVREVGRFFLPGDRLAFMNAYPGEPGYRGGRGDSDARS